jgi:serine phosphatase RsbU (regulator of sigma subunit)
MEQRSTAVKPGKRPSRSSLSTKFLTVVTAILATVVVFLTLMSIRLLSKDKTAYVFDAQSTACALAGREFAAYAQGSLDLVRHGLLLVDPFRAAPEQAVRQVQGLVDNQSVALNMVIGKYLGASGEFVPVAKGMRDARLKAAGLQEADVTVPSEVLRAYQKQWLATGSAFINISQTAKPPLVAVVLADRAAVANPSNIGGNGANPITGDTGLAYGVISLQSFQGGIPSSVGSLAIYTGQGDVLFHNESAQLIGGSAMPVPGAGVPSGAPSGASDPVFGEARSAKAVAGAKEVVIGGRSYLASFYKPGLDLVVSTRTETSQAMSTTYTLVEKLVFFGIFSIAVSVVVAIFFAKSLTRPLEQIAAATKSVAEGKFDIDLPVTSEDEVGLLARAVNTMSKKIGELVHKVADQARLEQELAVASTVQANLFPQPLYSDHQIRLKGFYQSASECGGDWWGHFRVGNKMVILIADATGHGIPSALMTAAIRGSFSTIHKVLRSRPDLIKVTPREIIPLANSAVFDSGRSGINMTFFIGIIDFDTRTMTYANAAHCPPWLLQPQPGKPIKARMLMSAGPRLGESPEIVEIEEHTVKLNPGDMIVFYTDGLLEGKNPEGHMYGKKRTRKIVESSYGRGEEFMVNSIVKDFLTFNGDKALDDDLTLVAAQLTPEAFQT